MHRTADWRNALRITLAVCVLLPGCVDFQRDVHYLGEPHATWYKHQATGIEYPAVCSLTPEEVQFSLEPHTIRDREHYEVRKLTLAEAIQTALQNAQVVRTNGQFLSQGNGLLLNPNGVASVWDPAIQETGVLFGGRGVEAALAAFDATWTASMLWGRNETVQNNVFGGGAAGGSVLTNETAQFNSVLEKTFGYGGSISLQHIINYNGNNVPPGVNLFESVYTGNLQAVYRQPLLAGAGAEFTRIAGPISDNFGGITGVSQGVVIARINSDLTVGQFELSLQNLVRDVEEAYWDLYLAYRNFNTASTARDSAQGTWELADKQAPAILLPADEAQARDQLYFARAAVLNTRSNLFTQETRLRRLMGLPVNDGTVLQPADEPATAEIVPDWYNNLTDALTHRVELRQQKWNIKSFELQLEAAKSLTLPRLDLIASWQVNGFGDQLLPYETQDPPAPGRLQSYYGTLINGDEQGWNLGVQMNVPIGFRQAHAQVRNYELRICKARKVLAEQEKEIAQELAASFQEVTRSYSAAIENYNRYQAAADNVEKLKPTAGTTLNIDVVLRAQERLASAEVAYFTSLVDYSKALANLQYRKGTILAYNNISVREGPWVGEAYSQSNRKAEARAYAKDAPWKFTEPREFANPFQLDPIELGAPGGLMSFPEGLDAMPTPAGVPPMPDGPPPAPAEVVPPAPAGDAPPFLPGDVPPTPGQTPPPGPHTDPFAPNPAPVTQAAWLPRLMAPPQ
jgi:outer membrane protein TolC